MAFFGVTLETLDRVWEHPNAGRLALAKAKGMDFQFVVGKDLYLPGDKVVYFPIDSLLPANVVEALGLVGRLSGKECNRVKTITLRGEISQGIVSRPETVLGHDWKWLDLSPAALTELLGVTKYDPPPIVGHAGNLLPLPDGIEVYDIEGADRYTEVVELLKDVPVQVTEKLEGTNFAAVREPDGQIYFCQRSYRIEEIDTGNPNIYAETARGQDVPELLNQLALQFPGERVTLRGELLGWKVQGNIYQLQKNEIRFFDLKVGFRYVDAEKFVSLIPENQRVPILAQGATLREWLRGQTIQQASNGHSVLLQGVRREGIVVKPLIERQEHFARTVQRLIIKQRSPEYLARE